jgi:RHS repeat-associated protein
MKTDANRQFRSVHNGQLLTSPIWTNITISATGQSNVSGNVFLPKTAESFTYDADGNLTADGRWTYGWDGENRLTNMTSLSTAPTASKLKLDFLYDSKGRRIQKLVSTNNGSVYGALYTNRFVYDGWNLVAILAPNSSLLNSFTWGSDVSGSQQGAGGVGGLLGSIATGVNTNFFAYDGNGNVATLVNTTDGTTAAQYEYGPFGEVIRATGPMAKAKPFRFSTKYQDDETDLLYYGYRYYSASTGRWLSRDPIEERGGRNLFAFVRNAPVLGYDALGRITVFPASDLQVQPCGGFNMDWAISLDRPAPANGYIVQEISFEYHATTCDNHTLNDSFKYWEAFPIAQNQIQTTMSGSGVDYWHYPASPGTKGSLMMTAHIKFFTGDLGINSPPWEVGGTWGGGWGGGLFGPPWPISSGSFPSTGQEPFWWNGLYPPVEEGGDRFVSVLWSCCCPEFYTHGVAMYVGQ